MRSLAMLLALLLAVSACGSSGVKAPPSPQPTAIPVTPASLERLLSCTSTSIRPLIGAPLAFECTSGDGAINRFAVSVSSVDLAQAVQQEEDHGGIVVEGSNWWLNTSDPDLAQLAVDDLNGAQQ